MATNTELKRYAQGARRQLREQVGVRLEQVLRVDSVEVRERKAAVDQLKKEIATHGKAEVVDKVAYTWFNRFCALRYMDVNLYNPIRVVSPAPGSTQPEILQEAKGGYIPDGLRNYVNKDKVFGLLNGTLSSRDGQLDAYRMLLVGVCNYYHKIMPFMFEEIEDYTELLMPQDLLSENSLLYQTRDVLTEEECRDVEVIGWLYQYYISERKDEVFAGLKTNQKIEAKDIPAATQLFTPHWIVRYLVENSLGRLWLLNHPDSKIINQMEYYIKPVEEETDYLKVTSPEDLKICDPACGSGHMLTYAFDLLYQIYEEQGYDPVKIPSLILQKNLWGIEIDGRAGALSAFALTMKARSKDKRFFTRDIQPNICVLENVSFTDQEIEEYIRAVGRDLFTEPLIETLKQFEQADNFGSLIQPILTNPGYARGVLEGKNLAGNILLYGLHEKVMKVLEYSEYLSSRYHVVVANPPYINSSSMNEQIKEFLNILFSDYKSDLFSTFVYRNSILGLEKSYIGMVNPNVWLYLSSYKPLRQFVVDQSTLLTLVELPLTGFKQATVQLCAYVFVRTKIIDPKGYFIRLVGFKGGDEEMANYAVQAIKDKKCDWTFLSSPRQWKKIPGLPIAYWVKEQIIRVFEQGKNLRSLIDIKQGMATSDNDRFLRYWFEISIDQIAFFCKSLEESEMRVEKWYPYNKGGVFRKWYGNNDLIVNWWKNGWEIKEFQSHLNQGWHVRLKSREYYFLPSLTWSFISSSYFSVRYSDPGFIFDVAGSSAFPDVDNYCFYLGYLCTNMVYTFLQIINPTLNFQVENIALLPLLTDVTGSIKKDVDIIVRKCVDISREDWDSNENSWNYSHSPLFNLSPKQKNERINFSKSSHQLNTLYILNSAHSKTKIQQLKLMEEENNRIFIDAYGLQDELTPEVKLEEITLTCNPCYKYGPGKTEEEYERLQRADTMKEFISYAVGCMFGRYSLDKPGLILANQGETLQDYLRQVTSPTYMPDEDNAIPILGGDWFADDISARFRKFLKLTFGEEHYSENLQFIEEAIGRDIETYFLRDFYPYHVKMYKKRPIYWLFSSPQGTFNVLIYMHRYTKDTVSIILNNYLREFRAKLEARRSFVEGLSISQSATQRDRTAALKELEVLKKQLEEITMYEREVIFPLATKQIEIDLDDGVKVNYPKFGDALAKIKGLGDS